MIKYYQAVIVSDSGVVSASLYPSRERRAHGTAAVIIDNYPYLKGEVNEAVQEADAQRTDAGYDSACAWMSAAAAADGVDIYLIDLREEEIEK